MKYSQYEDIDKPEGIKVPEGLDGFMELPNKVADELFMDEWSDLDRDWVLKAASAALRIDEAQEPFDVMCRDAEIGRILRLKVIDLATRAGDTQYARDTLREEAE